jgi:hypothetical protein
MSILQQLLDTWPENNTRIELVIQSCGSDESEEVGCARQPEHLNAVDKLEAGDETTQPHTSSTADLEAVRGAR